MAQVRLTNFSPISLTMVIDRIRQYVFGTNWLKTVRINFHYFPLKQAVRLPILVSKRTVFQELRGGVKIEGQAKTGMMLLGYQRLGIHDGFYNRTVWQVSGQITIKGEKIDIGRGSSLCVSGHCYLGDHFTITGKSTIICRKNVSFGDGVLISWDSLIMDTDYHYIADDEGQIINNEKPIIIGNDVWIGCRTTILKGTTIPSKSVIAAGALVTGKMKEENCIYSSDGRILKRNINWQR